MLSDVHEHYNETKQFFVKGPAEYKDDYPYLREVDSLALANKWRDLQAACRNFKKNKKFGFPKLKSRKYSKNSYTTNNQNGTIAIVDKGIRLPKIGVVKAVIHRQPEEGWKLKSATVSQDRDGKYYVSVLFEYERKAVEPKIITDETTIGLDYASNGLYVDSRGNRCNMPRFYRQSSERLGKQQYRLSKKQGSRKGELKSNNYKKQQLKVNKLHSHIAHQRKDYLHKKSTEIANQYSCVCVESLDMRRMANKGFGNGKSTLDNGYGMFLNMLEYKLADRGGYFIKVDKWYPSSQLCCSCGSKHPEMKDLSIRVMKCSCGTIYNRDHNAAINIRNEGLRIFAQTS